MIALRVLLWIGFVLCAWFGAWPAAIGAAFVLLLLRQQQASPFCSRCGMHATSEYASLECPHPIHRARRRHDAKFKFPRPTVPR